MCCSPALIHTHLHSFTGPCLAPLVYPHSVVLVGLAPICAHPHLFVGPCLFICTWLCWLGWPPFVLAATHSCMSLFSCPHLVALPGPCTHCCSFVLVSVHLLVPVCTHLVVSARLCLFLLPGGACLAFARACWCSFGFVCAHSASVHTCLGFIMLIYALMVFFWAPKPVCIRYMLVHK